MLRTIQWSAKENLLPLCPAGTACAQYIGPYVTEPLTQINTETFYNYP
jgi:hypothetical protein